MSNIFYKTNLKDLLTFFSITIFYFFESAQMSYFNVLAPTFLEHGIYHHSQIASLSSAYYYGDVAGLLPVGFMLDRFQLRAILLWAILGSVLAAFLLFLHTSFDIQWLARFFCGFFGGTFSFIGGIRILAALFPTRFALFMGLFLSAGMFGGLICQYPLLLLVNSYGVQSAMLAMASFGVLIIIINFLFLHPITQEKISEQTIQESQPILKSLFEIIKNTKNWLNCFLVVLLDTPVSIIGTLWGVVILTSVFHFSPSVSTWIVMSLFAGLMLGLPSWGAIADRYSYSVWIVITGASMSFFILILLLFNKSLSALSVAALFFSLGFFSSCQSLVFTWLTKNMKSELVGINSAFNSMVFMSMNGGIKQFCGYLLVTPSLFIGAPAGNNVLDFMLILMLIATVYVFLKRFSWIKRQYE